MPFPVIYDACVLYPAPLRDLLMRLALTGLFRAHWTERIHHEWMRSVLARRPELKPEALQRTRELMDSAVPDCLVAGYEQLEAGLALKDPDDRHVLAAAIRCHAGVIVTFNLRDFPQHALEPFHIEAQHPDEFIHHLFDLQRGSVCAAVKAQREALKNPPRTVEECLATLLAQGLPTTVAALRPMTALL
ncbi:putative nucleic acid-binding protein [Dyella sp. SG562]|uniref:PIN domain-containing protein n=1 Tax=Dyella sp. SG562 TaxID=2587017 RepID=UPI0031B89B94|nr:putative nucleic acid-binding protein [Dyella sp. SG562]